jgi:hypothetical protein
MIWEMKNQKTVRSASIARAESALRIEWRVGLRRVGACWIQDHDLITSGGALEARRIQC